MHTSIAAARWTTLVLTGFASSLLLASFIGCNGRPNKSDRSSRSSSKEDAKRGPAKVGDRAEAGGVALTVVSVQRLSSLGQFQKAKAGREFLVAEVVIETTRDKEAPYNPLYFKVKDGEGVEKNSTLNSLDNALKSGSLANGDKVRGTVVFDVSQGAKGLVLAYEPMVIGGGFKPIKVSLDE